MQANEFEKSIRSKMEGFELVPADDVWKSVSAEIKSDKKRKTFMKWFFGGMALLVITSAFLLLNNKNHDELSRPKTAINQRPITEQPAEETLKNNGEAVTSNASTTTADVAANVNPLPQKAVITGIMGNRAKVYISPTNEQNNLKVAANGLNLIEIVSPMFTPTSRLYEKNNHLLLHKYYNPQLAADTSKALASKAKLVEEEAEKEMATADRKIKKQAKNSLKFGFTAQAGISDNLSNISLLPNSAARNDMYFSLPTNSVGGNLGSGGLQQSSVFTGKLTYKTGFSYGFGVFAEKQLSSRFSITAGLNYQFYSASSAAGTKVDSAKVFYDSVLDKSAAVGSFFVPSQSETFVNKYHQVQLPVNLQFQLNRNNEKPLLFTVGVAPSYLFSTHALYLNYRSQTMYVEKEQFNRFQLTGQTGLSITLKNYNKYSISAGPVLQFGFTNLTKSILNTDQHLFFTGIKTAFTLK